MENCFFLLKINILFRIIMNNTQNVSVAKRPFINFTWRLELNVSRRNSKWRTLHCYTRDGAQSMKGVIFYIRSGYFTSSIHTRYFVYRCKENYILADWKYFISDFCSKPTSMSNFLGWFYKICFFSFAQWRYSNQWSNREVLLLLVNHVNFWIMATDTIMYDRLTSSRLATPIEPRIISA